jgi:hypothetical protein
MMTSPLLEEQAGPKLRSRQVFQSLGAFGKFVDDFVCQVGAPSSGNAS